MRAHYRAYQALPDRRAALPTGWNMLAVDQAGWKQVRDETVTQMIYNLQVNSENSRNEIEKSLATLQAAGHMMNVSLQDGVDEELVLPLVNANPDSNDDDDENDGGRLHDIFQSG